MTRKASLTKLLNNKDTALANLTATFDEFYINLMNSRNKKKIRGIIMGKVNVYSINNADVLITLI